MARSAGHGAAPPPHIFQTAPGVLPVSCGHCGTSFATDSHGHAERSWLGWCGEHQALQEDIDNGQIDHGAAATTAQE